MMEIEIPHDICSTTFFYVPNASGESTTVDPTCDYNQTSTSPSSQGSDSFLDESLIYTLKVLIKNFKKQMGEQPPTFVSGGLQQYLIKQEMKQKSLADSQKYVDQEGSVFHKLPVSIIIFLHSYRIFCCKNLLRLGGER